MSYEILIFIDYDNLLPTQREQGVLDVVSRILNQIDLEKNLGKITCQIRLYGGWYQGTDITRKAEDLTVEIQEDFPKIISIPSSGNSFIKIQTSAELAVSLIQEPSHHIFNTFRRKGKPNNIRVRSKSDVGCSESSCFIPSIRKLLKNGKCPKDGCSSDSGLIYRSEQKLVDTMLSCDLVLSAKSPNSTMILISSDDDFIPPLRTATLLGSAPIRVHPRLSNVSTESTSNNVNFREMEL